MNRALVDGKTHVVGIDIGGTKCAVLLGRPAQGRPTILSRVAVPTPPGGDPRALLARRAELADRLLAEAGLSRRDVGAVGVSCGGPLDERAGVVLSPPNLPGWEGVPVVDDLQRRLGIRTRLANDANAGALAEWWWGAGSGADTMIFLTFGTGLGAGLIVGGRLHAGPRGLAGEVGHIRIAQRGPLAYGKRGSWEGVTSGNGLRLLAVDRIRRRWAAGGSVSFCRDQVDLAALDVIALARAARAGDPLALGVFATGGRYLGRGIAILADVLDPDLVVVGGIYPRCLDLLQSVTLREFAAESLDWPEGGCRIVPSALGEAIGDYSALAVALMALDEESPTAPPP